MSVEQQLTLALREHADRLMRSARVEFEREVASAKSTPSDTGALATGVRAGSPRRIGNLISMEVESRTKAAGFDYPDFIDKVAAVMPTRRKYLRWFGPTGPIFSKGFRNPNRGWWGRSVTAAAWRRALTRALR